MNHGRVMRLGPFIFLAADHVHNNSTLRAIQASCHFATTQGFILVHNLTFELERLLLGRGLEGQRYCSLCIEVSCKIHSPRDNFCYVKYKSYFRKRSRNG